MMVVLGLVSGVAAAQPLDGLDAERRALDAERRAVAGERRALESEQRALDADRDASEGSSRLPSELEPRACDAATNNYELICSYPSRFVVGDTPQCAEAQAEMRRRCGG
jgi:hypothetical protein